MKRSGAIVIISLCTVLTGCVTSARQYHANLLPMLLGSLAMVELECAKQVRLNPAEEGPVVGILVEGVEEMRADKFFFDGRVTPCYEGGTHCMDSKCPSSAFADVVCMEAPSTTVSLEAAKSLVATEAFLRFAHEPSLRMVQRLDGHLRRTYDRVRARRR